MRFQGFVGGSAKAWSDQADTQRTVNLIPEVVESGTGKTQVYLRGVPGHRLFTTLADAPVRAKFEQNSRAFAVSGATFYEVHADGTATNRGAVANDGRPAQISSNEVGGKQLFVVSAGQTYLYNLTTNVLSAVGTTAARPFLSLYVDGYFLLLDRATGQLHHSALNNGLSWIGADVQQRNRGSDPFVTMGLNGNLVWLLGNKTGEVWYNQGGTTVFAPVQSVFLEAGCGAPLTLVPFDNSLAWLGQDADGAGRVWRAEGYGPKRISSHAVEEAIKRYARDGRIDDAEAWTYEWGGHACYVLDFPTAQATWQHDASTGLWCELARWNTVLGRYEAYPARCHAYAFGRHLVGSRLDGRLWELRDDVYAFDDEPLRWLRMAPHVSAENKWLFCSRFEIEIEAGVGVPQGQGSDPVIMTRISRDGGKTWGNERRMRMGKIGKYRQRAHVRRCGRARNFAFEASGSDPVKTALLQANLDLTVGTS